MKINSEIIDRLSALARLEFNSEEKGRIEADLNRILGFVDQLGMIDTKGIEPLIFLSDEVNVLREDIPSVSLTHEEALMNAPKKDSDYFRVPKVIE